MPAQFIVDGITWLKTRRRGRRKGAKGQKRPADVIGNAVKVMKTATGEEPEDFGADDGKDRSPSRSAAGVGRRGQVP